MGSERSFRRRPRQVEPERILHPAAAAERHRHAAHGPRLQPDDHGCADPLPPHARLQHAVAAGHRPRRHRDADRRRTPARRERHLAPRPRPREVHRESVGVEGIFRWHDHAPDAPPRHLARLEARALHDGRRPVEDGYRNFRAPLQRGADLPRQTTRQLGPEARHRGVRPRSRVGRGRRLPVAHHLPVLGRPGRRSCGPDRRDDPARDDARRRRGNGASGRRTLRPPDRQDGAPAAVRA